MVSAHEGGYTSTTSHWGASAHVDSSVEENAQTSALTVQFAGIKAQSLSFWLQLSMEEQWSSGVLQEIFSLQNTDWIQDPSALSQLVGAWQTSSTTSQPRAVQSSDERLGSHTGRDVQFPLMISHALPTTQPKSDGQLPSSRPSQKFVFSQLEGVIS